jgi:hypothetical protein
MTYQIVSDKPLHNEWLSDDTFTKTYNTLSHAIAFALEGVNDNNGNVYIIDTKTGKIAHRIRGGIEKNV